MCSISNARQKSSAALSLSTHVRMESASRGWNYLTALSCAGNADRSRRNTNSLCLLQPSFIRAFGLTKTDLPTLVAFHPKKLRGAQLQGSYSAQSIDTLLDGLFSGTIHSAAFQDLPALVEGGEEDAASMEPVEEEFDLADVLGEDVAGSGSKEDLLKQAEQELEVGRSCSCMHPQCLQTSRTGRAAG